MSNTTIRTMKLKISVFGEDTIQKQKTWSRIRQISNDTWKASNKIIQGQYENDILVDKIQYRLETNKKTLKLKNDFEKLINNITDENTKKILIKEQNEKIEQLHHENSQKFKSVFGTFRQATTQNDASGFFPNIPGTVLNPLNNDVYNNYISDKKEMYLGKKSIRSYKKGMPFPTITNSIIISKEIQQYTDKNNQKKIKDVYIVTWKITKTETAKFKIYLGKDKANYKETLDKIINNEYKISVPKIQLKDKNMIFHLPVNEPKKDTALNPDVCVGVDLGIYITAYMALNNCKKRLPLGSGMNIVRFRTQFQKRKNKLKKDISFVRGDKGRIRKNKCKSALSQKEHNTNKNYNNVISKKIVDFALNNNAGTIKLEFLKGISEDKKENMILKNWSFFQLQEMIKYKAKRENINVVFIDPYLTSYTCSNCGNQLGNERVDVERPKEFFKCTVCDTYIHADYNASLNIANSENIVTKKEDCMYNILLNQKKHCEECKSTNIKDFDDYTTCDLYIDKSKKCKMISKDVYRNHKKQTVKERIDKTLNKKIKKNSQSLG